MMADLNEMFEALADLLAEKVASRLQATDWPQTGNSTNTNYIDPRNPTIAYPPQLETKEEASSPTEVKLTQEPSDKRRAELSKIDVRRLRATMAQAEGKEVSEYTHLDKKTLINQIVSLETILGRTLEEEIARRSDSDEVPDDTDISDAEAEDDNESAELTREAALGMDLADLKSVAISNNISADKLKGLDVEAVVALIFGDETESDDVEDDDDTGEYTIDEIKEMNPGELKALAEDLNEQGAGIVFDRSTTSGELLKMILEVLEDDEE
jgi:hypothetical protein